MAVFASCSKTSESSLQNEPGQAVSFGIESEVTHMTKTSYSGIRDGDNMERINWINGDKIHIYCAEAHDTDADYTVTGTDKDEKYHRGTISPVAESMKWGETETHTFYSMYPAPSSSGVQDGVAMNANVVTAVLPVDQSFASGKINEKTPTPETYYADMNLAYMTAATKGQLYSEDKVFLSFTPIVTTFYVTITNDYPDSHAMNLQQIILSSATRAMTGTYRATMTSVVDKDHYTRTYTYAESGYNTSVDRTDANSYITYNWTGSAIASGESVTVALFALPQDITQLTLTIITDEGRSSLELKKNNAWIHFDGGKKHNISNLGVPEWEYDIDICDVDDTPATKTFTYTAGDSESKAFSVRSRKSRDGGANWIPTPWKAQYWSDTDSDGVQDDNEWVDIDPADYPAWLKSISPVKYSPSTATYESDGHTVTMTAQTLQTHEETLRTRWVTEINAAKRNVNGAYDKARVNLQWWNHLTHSNGSSTTTANCYIVQGPGDYIFPMVYGNGIDLEFAGQNPNTYAYDPPQAVNDYLNCFRNHCRNSFDYLGIVTSDRIKDAWISRHGTSTTLGVTTDYYGHHCTDVGVLWQDFKNGENVITNVGYLETNTFADDKSDRYVTFSVGDNISPGNALIYVKDANLKVVAWTWHIWITDQDLSPV